MYVESNRLILRPKERTICLILNESASNSIFEDSNVANETLGTKVPK